ncbi:MAG: hypothetical protein ABR575_06735 [Actinomycetota bacterium]
MIGSQVLAGPIELTPAETALILTILAAPGLAAGIVFTVVRARRAEPGRRLRAGALILPFALVAGVLIQLAVVVLLSAINDLFG